MVMGPNPFGGAGNWLSDNSRLLTRAGLGLLSGKTPQEQFANAAANIADERQFGQMNNKTVEYLSKNYPDLAMAVQNGILPADQAFKLATEAKTKKADPKAGLMGVGGAIYNANTGEWITPPEGAGGSSEYGLNPQYGVDANGNPVIVQLSKDGTSKQTALPPGVSLSKEPIKFDAGTHFVLLDPITRQPIGQVPKDLAGAEREKALGDAQGKAAASAAGDLQAGLNAKALIEQIKTSPYLDRGTGMSSVLSNIPGTGGYDFQNLVDQAKSGAFLTAIQQMRGLGALSNAEGGAATQAVTRMNTATSKEAFLKAVEDYEAIIDQGIARAQSRMPAGAAPAGAMDYKTKYGLD